ncbi:hypothetical protein NL676_022064 [Syzygium grande]|nr:hypothetical protein NL676_022064 [Syzygium grande]
MRLFFFVCHSIDYQSPGSTPEGVAWDEGVPLVPVGSLRSHSVHAVYSSGTVAIASPPPPRNGPCLHPPLPRCLPPSPHMTSAPGNTSSFPCSLPPPLLRRRRERRCHQPLPIASMSPTPSQTSSGKLAPVERHRFSLAPQHSLPSRRLSTPSYNYCGLNGSHTAAVGTTCLMFRPTWGRSPGDASSSPCSLPPSSPSSVDSGNDVAVNPIDGLARAVSLSIDLTLTDNIAVWINDVVVAVSIHKMWFLKSEDDWVEAVVHDKVALDVKKLSTSVALAAKERVYMI